MAAEDRENQEMKKESQLSMELGLVHFLKFIRLFSDFFPIHFLNLRLCP